MKFRKKINKLLGEILVEQGLLNTGQLKEAIELQIKEGGLIGEVIVSLGFAKEEDIAQCIALQCGFPYLPLEHYSILDEVLRLIPKNVASHYCLIPVDKIGQTLTIAMSNPLNAEAVEDIEDMTGLSIQILIDTSSHIRNAIARCYKE